MPLSQKEAIGNLGLHEAARFARKDKHLRVDLRTHRYESCGSLCSVSSSLARTWGLGSASGGSSMGSGITLLSPSSQIRTDRGPSGHTITTRELRSSVQSAT